MLSLTVARHLKSKRMPRMSNASDIIIVVYYSYKRLNLSFISLQQNTMHHLNPYYHYSAEILKTAMAAQQQQSCAGREMTFATTAFNIDNLLASRPLLPRPLSAAAAAYFPYLPTAASAAAAAFHLSPQQDMISGMKE